MHCDSERVDRRVLGNVGLSWEGWSFKELIKHLERKIEQVDVRTRTLMAGLREWMSFEPSYIQKVACEDEVDVEIITCLMQKGVGGLLPSAIATELGEYGLKRWDVTRRIQRMNKKLMKELGQKVAEKSIEIHGT